MRVKYQSQEIFDSTLVAGGTSEFWRDFLANIIVCLYEYGAPFDMDTLESSAHSTSTTEFGTAKANVKTVGQKSEIEFYVSKDSDSNRVYIEFVMAGLGEDNYIWGKNIYFDANRTYFNVCLHMIKSDNSFYFGFGNGAYGFIHTAITPIRRLSDPTADNGYAFLQGCYPVADNSNIVRSAEIGRTMPYVEGVNYRAYYTYFMYPTAPNILAYPDTETGKIPLIPLFAGIEDYYYENVYFTPMRSDGLEERAFETDKGVFLISNEVFNDADGNPIYWNNLEYCQLAFDITEAMNSAE